MSIIPKNSYIFYLIILLTIFDYALTSLKFNIPNNREKCFAEELFTDGTLLIRYDLKGIEYVQKEYQEKVLKNIKLYVKDPHGKIVKELFLIDLKGKFAIKTEEIGVYYICAKYFKTWKVTQLPKEVLLGIIEPFDKDRFIKSIILSKQKENKNKNENNEPFDDNDDIDDKNKESTNESEQSTSRIETKKRRRRNKSKDKSVGFWICK